MEKLKEFQWNKISKKDYLYFIVPRVHTHFVGFHNDYPQSNCWYLCYKENGDINSILTNIKRKLKNFLDVDNSFHRIFYSMVNQVQVDVSSGEIGKYCYTVQYDKEKELYFFYRTLLKDMKEKKKIIEMLKLYRRGDITISGNTSFSHNFNISKILDPLVLNKPYSHKKQKMYQNGK